ncbi:MAG TPA: TIGR03086 family metal-binding protein [Pseudonocardiaceae bacterium]|nr:TIGR03086 family metal-binding protein [Pseudonocardiaceae bacterium]
MDIQDLDRRAVRTSVALVRQVTPDRLDLPTPCAEWDLRALLAHLTVQHIGFARAVAGERTELVDWRPEPLADDFVAAYERATDQVIESFAAPAGRAYLPEIRGGVTVPGAMAMGFHFIDYVVHSWDVAAAIGVPVEFDDEVLAAALTVAGQVPADAASRGPGTAFDPVLPEPAGAATLDRVLAMLGRSPAWPH